MAAPELRSREHIVGAWKIRRNMVAGAMDALGRQMFSREGLSDLTRNRVAIPARLWRTLPDRHRSAEDLERAMTSRAWSPRGDSRRSEVHEVHPAPLASPRDSFCFRKNRVALAITSQASRNRLGSVYQPDRHSAQTEILSCLPFLLSHRSRNLSSLIIAAHDRPLPPSFPSLGRHSRNSGSQLLDKFLDRLD